MVECITSEEKQFDEVACDVSPSYIKPPGEVRESETLIDRTDVSHSITTVYYNTC